MVMSDLDVYEAAIVKALSERHHYDYQEAMDLFLKYRSVLKRLGGYDMPHDMADYLQNAITKGMTPEAWHAHIDRAREIKRRMVVRHIRELLNNLDD
jgi:hypothetical protein